MSHAMRHHKQCMQRAKLLRFNAYSACAGCNAAGFGSTQEPCVIDRAAAVERGRSSPTRAQGTYKQARCNAATAENWLLHVVVLCTAVPVHLVLGERYLHSWDFQAFLSMHP
jgi:hypothetical protein